MPIEYTYILFFSQNLAEILRADTRYTEPHTHLVVPQPTANHSLLTANSSFTFSAKERDPETGLSYFGSRYYSSDLSVWLSVDPMSDKYPSLSPYTYCADNPVKLVDPDGETWDTPEDEKKAEELKSKANEQILSYQKLIEQCYAKYNCTNNSKKKENLLKSVDYINGLISEVQKGIDGLGQMCEDAYYYHFEEIERRVKNARLS